MLCGQSRDTRTQITTGIAGQRHQIICGVADHRILEIQQPNAADSFATGQPDKVFSMEVAQYCHRTLRCMALQAGS